jgi:hypothetical protein
LKAIHSFHDPVNESRSLALTKGILDNSPPCHISLNRIISSQAKPPTLPYIYPPPLLSSTYKSSKMKMKLYTLVLSLAFMLGASAEQCGRHEYCE